MKLASLLLSTLMTLSFFAQSAMAGNFTIEKTSLGTITSVQGEAFAPKCGNLVGTRLTILIDNDVVKINDLTPQKSRQTVVSGKCFNMHIKSETDEVSRLEGYCFLNAGEKLSAFLGSGANTADTADFVLTTDGQQLTGSITSIDRGVISIVEKGNTRLVRTRDIRSIASSHVYKLSALIFGDANINDAAVSSTQAKILRFDLDQTLDDFMTASGKKRMETAIDAAGYNKWQRGALLGASVLITGAAIAVPVAIAVPLAGRHRGGTFTAPESTPLVEIQR